MSRASFHADPDIEGEVLHALEEAGFEVELGNGPMVDWTVDKGDRVDCPQCED